MRYLTILLLCVILLVACWSGPIQVGGVYYDSDMVGPTQYFVDLIGRADHRVTLGVYEQVLEFAKEMTEVTEKDCGYSFSSKIACDFEWLPNAPHIYDQVTYCE